MPRPKDSARPQPSRSDSSSDDSTGTTSSSEPRKSQKRPTDAVAVHPRGRVVERRHRSPPRGSSTSSSDSSYTITQEPPSRGRRTPVSIQLSQSHASRHRHPSRQADPTSVDGIRTDHGSRSRVSMGYVAQTAYTQQNPFRRHSFADFSTNPDYRAPSQFALYPDVSAFDEQGLLLHTGDRQTSMVQQLIQARTHGSSSTYNQRALGRDLEDLRDGSWFYKWTRTYRVHPRFVRLNFTRGVLEWSPSPNTSVLKKSELVLSEVLGIRPDIIQDKRTHKALYRLTISTSDRPISFATEVKEKFNFWFHALVALTRSNVDTGVPALWSRPSSIAKDGQMGFLGRWASRYSPLHALVDGTRSAPVRASDANEVLLLDQRVASSD